VDTSVLIDVLNRRRRKAGITPADAGRTSPVLIAAISAVSVRWTKRGSQRSVSSSPDLPQRKRARPDSPRPDSPDSPDGSDGSGDSDSDRGRVLNRYLSAYAPLLATHFTPAFPHE
jgi:hypothetical protein